MKRASSGSIASINFWATHDPPHYLVPRNRHRDCVVDRYRNIRVGGDAMRYFPTRKEDDIRDLGKLVAKAVADALANINTGAGNIVVIRKINVSINYAS